MIAVLASLLAAACFAASSVAEHRAASTCEAPGSPLRVAVRLVRRPLWLFGTVIGLAGFAAQTLALAAGSLVVVQVLLVSGLLMALPAGIALERRRPRRREWLCALAVVVGLAVFLVASRPQVGLARAPSTTLAVGAGLCAAAVGVGLIAASAVRGPLRSLLLGACGGACFGLTGALLKQVVGDVGADGGSVHLLAAFGDWPLPALVVAGLTGVVSTQAAYRAGVLAAAQPALTVVEPLVAAILGATAFAEHLDHSPLAVGFQVTAVIVMVAGVVGLAGPSSSATAPPSVRPEVTVRPEAAVRPDPTVLSEITGLPEITGPGASRQRSVLIVSGSVGAGHDGAAAELASRLRARGLHVDVRDYMAALPWPFPFLLREGYTLSVGKVPAFFQWLFIAIETHASVRMVLFALCRSAQGQVLRWSTERPYAAVISTYPMASQSLGELRAAGHLVVPAISYLTDPAAHRCWIHTAVDHHWTVTAATAAQGSADYGVVMREVGPLVPARFAVHDPAAGRAARAELGIDPSARVALMVAGSLGLGDVEHSAAAVARAGLVPLVLCGRNDGLRARVGALDGVVALGWRDDVHHLMAAADLLVHNAGGLSFTEALVAGLPAVSYRCIPGHGLANAAVLDSAGLATWARCDDDLASALRVAAARGRRPVVHDDPARHVVDLIAAASRPRQVLPAPRLARARALRVS